MRIRNLSHINVPRELWRALAGCMKVGGLLPGAVRDEYGMYRGSKTLRVTVRPARKVELGRVVELGSHTYGKIRFLPCRNCTSGTLTHTYLHELFHAWMFQYHQKLYDTWSHCGVAERFADAGFRRLEGRIGPRRVCGSFHLRGRVGRDRLASFRALADTLTRCSPSQVRRWSPPGAPRASR